MRKSFCYSLNRLSVLFGQARSLHSSHFYIHITHLTPNHRELRDSALDEASRTKSELRQLRAAHEELLVSSREAAGRADVAASQLMGELKLKGFELTRLQVRLGF